MIKVIAMDMDGTLLSRENKILPQTKAKLMELQKQGIRLVLASGRSYCKLMDYAKELQMEKYGGFLLEVNGLALYDLQHQKRYVRSQMEQAHVAELFAYFKQWDVEFIAQFDDGMFDYNPPAVMQEKQRYRDAHQLPQDFPWTGGAFDLLVDHRKGYPKLTYIQDAQDIHQPINKVSVTHHEELMAVVSEQAKQDLAGRYWVGMTSPKWLEIMLPGITKGSGLHWLSELLHIELSDIMAFGDGENDIDMLQEAGIGIAMGNAMDIVKQAADVVTGGNDEEGIAQALQRYW